MSKYLVIFVISAISAIVLMTATISGLAGYARVLRTERDALQERLDTAEADIAAMRHAASVLSSAQRRADDERNRIKTEATEMLVDAGHLDTGELDPGVCAVALDAYDRLVCGASDNPVPGSDTPGSP